MTALMTFANIKLFAGGLGMTILASTYLYKKHMFEKEMMDQYNYLLDNNIKLSGVYIQQRQAFPVLWYIQWLIPYHQSIKIVHKDGSIRHVGLGGRKVNRSGPFDMRSEFIEHVGPSYEKWSKYEKSLPVECFVPYKRYFGHFPNDINIAKLEEITMTRNEALSKGINDPEKSIYVTTFGSFFRGIYDKWVMSTCNYAVIHALRQEELARQNK